VRVSSTRLVSFAQRSVAAILYEIEPVDGEATVVVQSELVANESVPAAGTDPRVSAVLAAPLAPKLHTSHEQRAVLVHATKASGLTMAAAMDHVIECASPADISNETYGDVARVTVATSLRTGQPLRVVKFLSYGWSEQRSVEAVRDQVAAGLAGGRRRGWDGLLEDQRDYLDDYWKRADIEIDGDAELQQAVRFAMFHTLQAGARGERRAIPAKGLTGSGYDGHTFWDTEAYVLGVLTYMAPNAAGDALRWRHQTLDLARNRAEALGLRGAAFPWRTIHGEECSGYWPAGTAAFHINADIAAAAVRYQLATDDQDFDRDVGVELLAETARLWRSLGHHDAAGNFRIDGVTGPDEYSAIADNNVYTNLMAQQNLRAAADAAERQPERAVELGVTPPTGCSFPTTTRWASTPRPKSSPSTSGGTSPPQSPRSTRCSCTSPTSICTASRWSSRRTSYSRCSAAVTSSQMSRRPGTSTTTSSLRFATLHSRLRSRPSWRPRSATWTWRMTTLPRRR
jgi:alpha,alpha-trehalose phosphorylase